MRISLLQMDVVLGKPEENRAKVEAMAREAMRSEPDVLALPEMWNTGFFPRDAASIPDREGETVKSLLSGLAKRHRVNVMGGSAANRQDGGRPRNTSYVFNRRGELVASYDKIHLFSPSGENETFQHGNEIAVFSFDGMRAGVAICYDLRFPELIRMLALEGIGILFLPAAWPHPRLSHWRALLRARAIENQMFVAAINGVGKAGQMKFCGNSMVVDPWGEVLACAGEEETILTAQIDFAAVDDIRARINVLNDRRPELYRLSESLRR